MENKLEKIENESIIAPKVILERIVFLFITKITSAALYEAHLDRTPN